MSPHAWSRAVSVGAGVLCLAVFGAATAAAAPNDLIDSTPAVVELDVPAPGETLNWEMSVRNLTDDELPLSLEILGGGDQVLFTGPAPLELTIEERSGDVLVDSVPVGDLLDSTTELPDLPAGATYELSGSVTLPREADNRYQGVAGSLTLRFVTALETPATPDGPGKLPLTGAEAVLPLAVLAAGLALAGALIMIAVRSRSKGAQS